MAKNLVIVESPAKAKTIEGYLGKDFTVTSSYGHIRDLVKKDKGVDVENDFTPIYKIPEDKKKVVTELKKLSGKAETVWLATDEDREGEAISWHLKEALELDEKKIKRIVFDEITKTAILNAIKNPRKIDYNLVDAQQARRILDRLVGFEVSGILWRKVQSKLSAGRVQSVAVRLIVEREREIDSFVPEPRFKVVAHFIVEDEKGNKTNLKAELARFLKDEKEAETFLTQCAKSEFIVDDVEKKPVKRSPAAPFTTSTLQQEAARKLRYSVSRTMLLAQRLYEAGKITYMRTDSVNLSDFAIDAAEQTIKQDYGKEYLLRRQFKTKSKSAQEAHEAIRPTDFNKETVDGPKDEQALYELIWKRAIASQMSDAEIERTTAKIKISGNQEILTAKGEVIKFDGFLKVYLEDTDEENLENGDDAILPPLKIGQKLDMKEIVATERYTRPSARYTEASLVKKLEELGIGRPSTYAPTISTIQKRGYIIKENRDGKERKLQELTLNKKKEIKHEKKTEITGADKGKLFPADIAMIVTDFLNQHFPQIMDYQFTAKVEDELDEVAMGKISYPKMLKDFYFPFHKKVEHTTENSERASGERILGVDPKTKKTVSVRMARFGPVAQLTDPNDPEAKPEYAGIRRDQKMELITLDEALELFKLPRVVGTFEDKEIVAAIGRFGPYLRHDGKFIKVFDEDPTFQILNGRWGPYLKAGKKNVKLPKDRDPASLTFEECVELANNAVESKGKKKGFRKKKE